MIKLPKINWQKTITREYPFLWADYTNDAYKVMENVVGTTMRHNLFYGDKEILNIYRDPGDIDRSYRMIDKVTKNPAAVVGMMDEYDALVARNYRLFKEIARLEDKKVIKLRLIELDKNFLRTVMYFLFFAFLGFGADKPNIRKFLKKYGKRFDKIRMYTIDMDMKREFSQCFSKYNRTLSGFAPLMRRRELLIFLKTGQINRDKISQRAKSYLVVTKNLRTKEYGLANIKKVLEKELAHLKIDAQAKLIKGQTACLGNVRGKAVVVLSKKDYCKIKTGDILVTTMTKPDIVPYLKRVKGIITNDGGALSHASIISREMKIPCLTGTKYATDIIKDGDQLYLRASEGLVERMI